MNALSGCVASLTLSTETLQSTIDTLSASVEDYPRVCKILSSNRHFELISARELQTAQTLLSSTIQPETDRLLRETEKAVHKLELKERKLIADSELLETRIANSLKTKSAAEVARKIELEAEQKEEENENEKETAKNEEVLRRLKAQRQRLAYAVERLELEKRQKEMQVKKSLSYSHV